MPIKPRKCSSCAAFHTDPDAPAAASECWNLTTIIERPGTARALRRAPGPTDCCGHHLTHQEDAAETAHINANRDAIMAGIRRLAAEQQRQNTERNQLRDAEVGAERILQRVIVKMRKDATS